MVVKKKLIPSAKSFIDKGADVKPQREVKSFKNILVRIPVSTLNGLDYCVEKKPWMNRTQWILEAIHYKLKNEFTDFE